MAGVQFGGGFPGQREKTVLSAMLSIVNLALKLLSWLVYKMSHPGRSQCPATFPKGTLCCRTPKSPPVCPSQASGPLGVNI